MLLIFLINVVTRHALHNECTMHTKRDTNWNQWAGKSSRLELARRRHPMHLDAHPHGQPCSSCAACSLRDRESCIDKSSPTFARPAYTAGASPPWRRASLVTYRYPHGAPCHGSTSCEPRLRDRLDTADGNLPEKSAINADARGRREGREVTRKRNIPSSRVRRETSCAMPP